MKDRQIHFQPVHLTLLLLAFSLALSQVFPAGVYPQGGSAQPGEPTRSFRGEPTRDAPGESAPGSLGEPTRRSLPLRLSHALRPSLSKAGLEEALVAEAGPTDPFYEEVKKRRDRVLKLAVLARKQGFSIGFSPKEVNALSRPQRVFTATIPWRLDDGTTRTVLVARVKDAFIPGQVPAKGGIRAYLQPYALGEIRGSPEQAVIQKLEALAKLMTWKGALARLPLGGGKGAYIALEKVEREGKTLYLPFRERYSPQELARLEYAVGRLLAEREEVGPEIDVPAPDMGTDAWTMARLEAAFLTRQLSDPESPLRREHPDLLGQVGSPLGLPAEPGLRLSPEREPDLHLYAPLLKEVVSYVRQTGHPVRELAAYTGKPEFFGGSPGRDEATALWGFLVAEEAVRRIRPERQNWKRPLKGFTVAVQGFGKAGEPAVRFFTEAGARVSAFSDVTGHLFKKGGFTRGDLETLAEFKRAGKPLKEMPRLSGVDFDPNPDKLLELKVDILVPSAIEMAVTRQNASKVKAWLVVPVANGGVTLEAAESLAQRKKRKILVVPDTLASLGGETVSWFEMLQNFEGREWPLEKVQDKLRESLKESMDSLWEAWNRLKRLDPGVSLMTAADVVSHRVTAKRFVRDSAFYWENRVKEILQDPSLPAEKKPVAVATAWRQEKHDFVEMVAAHQLTDTAFANAIEENPMAVEVFEASLRLYPREKRLAADLSAHLVAYPQRPHPSPKKEPLEILLGLWAVEHPELIRQGLLDGKPGDWKIPRTWAEEGLPGEESPERILESEMRKAGYSDFTIRQTEGGDFILRFAPRRPTDFPAAVLAPPPLVPPVSLRPDSAGESAAGDSAGKPAADEPAADEPAAGLEGERVAREAGLEELTWEERELLERGTFRLDGRPALLHPEEDTARIFQWRAGDGDPPNLPIPGSLFQGREVLVVPGYGTLPFLLMELGASRVLGIDVDPVTVAWQKARALYGKYPGVKDGFEVYDPTDRSRLVASLKKLAELAQWEDPEKYRIPGIWFKQGNLTRGLPVGNHEFDLVVVPYLLGISNGVQDPELYPKVFNELARVIRPEGYLVVLPVLMTADATEGTPLYPTVEFSRWLLDQQWDPSWSNRFRVELSLPFFLVNLLSQDKQGKEIPIPVQGHYALIQVSGAAGPQASQAAGHTAFQTARLEAPKAARTPTSDASGLEAQGDSESWFQGSEGLLKRPPERWSWERFGEWKILGGQTALQMAEALSWRRGLQVARLGHAHWRSPEEAPPTLSLAKVQRMLAERPDLNFLVISPTGAIGIVDGVSLSPVVDNQEMGDPNLKAGFERLKDLALTDLKVEPFASELLDPKDHPGDLQGILKLIRQIHTLGVLYALAEKYRDPNFSFIARDTSSGRIVAAAVASPPKEGPSDTLDLSWIGVDEAYRNRGIGRLLMEAVFSAAQRAPGPSGRGFARVVWETSRSNSAAQRFYETLGAKRLEGSNPAPHYQVRYEMPLIARPEDAPPRPEDAPPLLVSDDLQTGGDPSGSAGAGLEDRPAPRAGLEGADQGSDGLAAEVPRWEKDSYQRRTGRALKVLRKILKQAESDPDAKNWQNDLGGIVPDLAMAMEQGSPRLRRYVFSQLTEILSLSQSTDAAWAIRGLVRQAQSDLDPGIRSLAEAYWQSLEPKEPDRWIALIKALSPQVAGERYLVEYDPDLMEGIDSIQLAEIQAALKEKVAVEFAPYNPNEPLGKGFRQIALLSPETASGFYPKAEGHRALVIDWGTEQEQDRRKQTRLFGQLIPLALAVASLPEKVDAKDPLLTAVKGYYRALGVKTSAFQLQALLDSSGETFRKALIALKINLSADPLKPHLEGTFERYLEQLQRDLSA